MERRERREETNIHHTWNLERDCPASLYPLSEEDEFAWQETSGMVQQCYGGIVTTGNCNANLKVTRDSLRFAKVHIQQCPNVVKSYV